MQKRTFWMVVALTFGLAFGSGAAAVDYTWDGLGDTNWANSGNWGGGNYPGVPGGAADSGAIFDAAAATDKRRVDIDNSINLGTAAITVAGAGVGGYEIKSTAGNNLTAAGLNHSATGANIISAALAIGAGGASVTAGELSLTNTGNTFGGSGIAVTDATLKGVLAGSLGAAGTVVDLGAGSKLELDASVFSTSGLLLHDPFDATADGDAANGIYRIDGMFKNGQYNSGVTIAGYGSDWDTDWNYNGPQDGSPTDYSAVQAGSLSFASTGYHPNTGGGKAVYWRNDKQDNLARTLSLGDDGVAGSPTETTEYWISFMMETRNNTAGDDFGEVVLNFNTPSDPSRRLLVGYMGDDLYMQAWNSAVGGGAGDSDAFTQNQTHLVLLQIEIDRSAGGYEAAYLWFDPADVSDFDTVLDGNHDHEVTNLNFIIDGDTLDQFRLQANSTDNSDDSVCIDELRIGTTLDSVTRAYNPVEQSYDNVLSVSGDSEISSSIFDGDGAIVRRLNITGAYTLEKTGEGTLTVENPTGGNNSMHDDAVLKITAGKVKLYANQTGTSDPMSAGNLHLNGGAVAIIGAALEMDDTDVTLSESSILELTTDGTAALGHLTIGNTGGAGETTSLNISGGGQGLGFLATTITGDENLSFHSGVPLTLGAIDASGWAGGGAGLTITATGGGELVLNGSSSGGLDTTLVMIESDLTLVHHGDDGGGSNPVRSSIVHFHDHSQGKSLNLSSTDVDGLGTDEATFDFTLELADGQDEIYINAGEHGSGSAGAARVILGDGANAMDVHDQDHRIYLAATDGYTLEIDGAINKYDSIYGVTDTNRIYITEGTVALNNPVKMYEVFVHSGSKLAVEAGDRATTSYLRMWDGGTLDVAGEFWTTDDRLRFDGGSSLIVRTGGLVMSGSTGNRDWEFQTSTSSLLIEEGGTLHVHNGALRGQIKVDVYGTFDSEHTYFHSGGARVTVHPGGHFNMHYLECYDNSKVYIYGTKTDEGLMTVRNNWLHTHHDGTEITVGAYGRIKLGESNNQWMRLYHGTYTVEEHGVIGGGGIEVRDQADFILNGDVNLQWELGTHDNNARITGTGHATVQNLVIRNNSTIAPGQSIGTLEVVASSQFRMENGSIYEWEVVQGGAAGTDYDQIAVYGNLNFDSTWRLRLKAAPGAVGDVEAGDTFDIFTYTGSILDGFNDWVIDEGFVGGDPLWDFSAATLTDTGSSVQLSGIVFELAQFTGEFTWNGNDADWAAGSEWTDPGPPTLIDKANADGGTAHVTTNQSVHTLEIDGGNVSVDSNTLTVTDRLDVLGGGSVTVAAGAGLLGVNTLNLASGGSLDVQGDLEAKVIDLAAPMSFGPAASLTGVWEMNVNAGGSVGIGSNITLPGTPLTFDGGNNFDLGGFTLTVGTYTQVSGTAGLDSGGTVAADQYILENGTIAFPMVDASPSTVTVQGGTVTLAAGHTHTYTGATLVQSGTLNVDSPITATADFDVQGGATANLGAIVTSAAEVNLSGNNTTLNINSGGGLDAPGAIVANLTRLNVNDGDGLSDAGYTRETPVTVETGGHMNLGVALNQSSEMLIESFGLLEGNITNLVYNDAGGSGNVSFRDNALILATAGPLPTLAEVGGVAKLLVPITQTDQAVTDIGNTSLKGAYFAQPFYPHNNTFTGTLTSGGGAGIHVINNTHVQWSNAKFNADSGVATIELNNGDSRMWMRENSISSDVAPLRVNVIFSPSLNWYNTEHMDFQNANVIPEGTTIAIRNIRAGFHDSNGLQGTLEVGPGATLRMYAHLHAGSTGQLVIRDGGVLWWDWHRRFELFDHNRVTFEPLGQLAMQDNGQTYRTDDASANNYEIIKKANISWVNGHYFHGDPANPNTSGLTIGDGRYAVGWWEQEMNLNDGNVNINAEAGASWVGFAPMNHRWMRINEEFDAQGADVYIGSQTALKTTRWWDNYWPFEGVPNGYFRFERTVSNVGTMYIKGDARYVYDRDNLNGVPIVVQGAYDQYGGLRLEGGGWRLGNSTLTIEGDGGVWIQHADDNTTIGTLIINAADGLRFEGGEELDILTKLGGSGSVKTGNDGHIRVRGGAILAPGQSAGTLGVDDLYADNGYTYEWEIDPIAEDKVQVNDRLELPAGAGAWTLKVLGAGGFMDPAVEYDLFTYGGSYAGDSGLLATGVAAGNVTLDMSDPSVAAWDFTGAEVWQTAGRVYITGVSALTYATWGAAGDWSTPATWAPDVEPIDSTKATLNQPGATVTVTQAGEVAFQVLLDNGTVNMTAGDLTVGKEIDVAAPAVLNQSGGSLSVYTLNTAGTTTLAGSGNITNLNVAGGTCTISTPTITNIDVSGGELISNAAALPVASFTVGAAGTVTATATALSTTGNVSLAGTMTTTGTIAADGNVTISGTFSTNNDVSAVGSLTLDGATVNVSGTVDMSNVASVTIINKPNLNITGAGVGHLTIPTSALLPRTLAYYSFNDETYDDASGNDYHGYAIGAPTFNADVPANIGDGKSLDCRGGNNAMGVTDGGDFNPDSEEVTVAFWVKSPPQGNWSHTVSKGWGDNNGWAMRARGEWNLGTENGRRALYINLGDTSQWNHWVLSYQSTNVGPGLHKAWRNGNEASWQMNAVGKITDITQDFRICFADNEYSQQQIDELYIFDRLLTNQERLDLFYGNVVAAFGDLTMDADTQLTLVGDGGAGTGLAFFDSITAGNNNHIDGSVVLADNSRYLWEVVGGINDLVNVTGDLGLRDGWKLTILAGSDAPALGQSYDLFTYGTLNGSGGDGFFVLDPADLDNQSGHAEWDNAILRWADTGGNGHLFLFLVGNYLWDVPEDQDYGESYWNGGNPPPVSGWGRMTVNGGRVTVEQNYVDTDAAFELSVGGSGIVNVDNNLDVVNETTVSGAGQVNVTGATLDTPQVTIDGGTVTINLAGDLASPVVAVDSGVLRVADTTTLSVGHLSLGGSASVEFTGGSPTVGAATQVTGTGQFIVNGGEVTITTGATIADTVSILLGSGSITIPDSSVIMPDGSLTFDGGTLISTGTTVDRTTHITAAGGTVEVAAGTTLTMASNPASWLGNLIKTGDGTLAFDGGLSMSGAAEVLRVTGGQIASGTAISTSNGAMLSVAATDALGGGGMMTLDNGVLRATASATINRNITLGAGGGTFDTDGGGTVLTLSSLLGSTAITKIGDGTLDLSGLGLLYNEINANAGTVVTATYQLGQPSANAINIGDGAIVEASGGIARTVNGTGSGMLYATGNAIVGTHAGGFDFGGTLKAAAGVRIDVIDPDKADIRSISIGDGGMVTSGKEIRLPNLAGFAEGAAGVLYVSGDTTLGGIAWGGTQTGETAYIYGQNFDPNVDKVTFTGIRRGNWGSFLVDVFVTGKDDLGFSPVFSPNTNLSFGDVSMVLEGTQQYTPVENLFPAPTENDGQYTQYLIYGTSLDSDGSGIGKFSGESSISVSLAEGYTPLPGDEFFLIRTDGHLWGTADSPLGQMDYLDGSLLGVELIDPAKVSVPEGMEWEATSDHLRVWMPQNPVVPEPGTLLLLLSGGLFLLLIRGARAHP